MKTVIRLNSFVMCLCLVLYVGVNESFAQSVILDNFEQSSMRIAIAGEPDPQYLYLWNQYPGDFTEGPDPGTTALSTLNKHSGSKSLETTLPGPTGNIYLQFYNHNGAQWGRVMDKIISGTWQTNTFNRLRFWIKVGPTQMTYDTQGYYNFNFATYVHRNGGDYTNAEVGGNHYYHFLNIPYTGQWHQVIIDWHPNHERGGSGSTEWGEKQYPTTSGTSWNYFDALTRFYVDATSIAMSYPQKYYVDDFEIYQDTHTENVAQVYSVNGVYVPTSNRLYVGWMRLKTDDVTHHEVRYAFSDIHTMGWNAATAAPNGNITPPGPGGPYNSMYYDNNTINMGTNPNIYVAIRPVGAQTFRQIVIPLGSGGGGDTSPPAAPLNLRVQ